MNKLKKFLNNKWFFPVLILYYGVFYILFGETYPYNGGLTADGFVFSTFIPDFTKSFFFDIYYVNRIFPSFVISVFFKLLSLNPSEQNIFIAFQILNLVSIVLSCYFLKCILILFKISFRNQLLAFTLFLINFGVIKYPFYLPVMTDTFGLMLSSALLYFYLKNNIRGIIIITLLAAFSWPMSYYQGLLLIAFPICILPFSQALKWQKTLVYAASVFYILGITMFFIFMKNLDTTVSFVAKIDRNLLVFSTFGIVLLFFFFAKLFLNKSLLDYTLFLKKINYKRLLTSLGVFISVLMIIHFLQPKQNSMYPISLILSGPMISSLIKPLITIVSHVSYFGIIVCLLIIFWNSFCKTVSQFGWGIVAAFGLNLFLFGITTESRQLINLLPWVIVFLIKAINKYSFSTSFYLVVGLLSFVASKIWLLLNIYEINSTLNIDKNGNMGFPSQILWMNIGPWMSEQMYYIQGGVMLIFIGILFLMLYKVEVKKITKIRLVRKY